MSCLPTLFLGEEGSMKELGLFKVDPEEDRQVPLSSISSLC
jgi:hypothetical protein